MILSYILFVNTVQDSTMVVLICGQIRLRIYLRLLFEALYTAVGILDMNGDGTVGREFPLEEIAVRTFL